PGPEGAGRAPCRGRQWDGGEPARPVAPSWRDGRAARQDRGGATGDVRSGLGPGAALDLLGHPAQRPAGLQPGRVHGRLPGGGDVARGRSRSGGSPRPSDRRAPPGGMLAVPLPEEALHPELGPALSLAAVNGPATCVVSGPAEEIASLASRLAEREIPSRR